MNKTFAAIALSFSLLGATSALADEAACTTFKWSLVREQGWLQQAHPTLASGVALASSAGAATLQLSPAEGLAFAVPPGHKPASGSFGAILTVPALDKDGIYQVTLSGEGWIDVIQAGASIKSSAFSGVKGCPGLRKSVRFDLKAGPATLQISSVKEQTIDLAIGPAS